jgi:hypothetical protein
MGERASHNQIYTVSAEPVIVDKGEGWINVKMEIRSELGTDSVAFNMIVRRIQHDRQVARASWKGAGISNISPWLSIADGGIPNI